MVTGVIYNIKTAILSGCGFFCGVIISVIGGIGVIGVAFTYNTYNTYSKKSFILQKNGHVPKGVADQQSKNHILQKEYLPFYIFCPYAPALLGIFGALWELSQVKQCATLKTFPKSRINPNCRVIQIVTLFICVGAVTAPCCLRVRGNTSRASNGELLPST